MEVIASSNILSRSWLISHVKVHGWLIKGQVIDVVTSEIVERVHWSACNSYSEFGTHQTHKLNVSTMFCLETDDSDRYLRTSVSSLDRCQSSFVLNMDAFEHSR